MKPNRPWQPKYQYRPEEREKIPLAAIQQAYSVNSDEMESIFGNGGVLSKLSSSYQCRPAQLRLADNIWKSLRQRRPLIGEAGTGTGKSLAYLVPAIEHAVLTGRKVLIGTANLALIDQIKNKDLPNLLKALHQYLNAKYRRTFKAVVAKGKNNYACLEKLYDGIETPLGFDDEVKTFHNWHARTSTGDLAEVGINLKDKHYQELRQAVSVVNRGECRGSKCSYAQAALNPNGAQPCWYYHMKQQLLTADVIITNHHLIWQHYAEGGTIFPHHDAVILDEAHAWEEIVIGRSQRVVCADEIERALVVGDFSTKLNPAAMAMFKGLSQIIKDKLGRRLYTVDILPEDITESVRSNIGSTLIFLNHFVNDLMASGQEQFADQVLGWCVVLTALHKGDPAWTFWGDRDDEADLIPLRASLIDISKWQKAAMAGIPWIFTSATLATTSQTDTQFEHLKKALGMDGFVSELNVGSPYDYRKQAFYYAPMTDPNLVKWQKDGARLESSQKFCQRWCDGTEAEYRYVINAMQGHTLCLFTSKEAMLQMAHRLKNMRWPMRTQGDASADDLVRWMKSTPNSVLFATQSFWEGIDIPGKALSCVIIDRIPLTSPEDPVYRAKARLQGRETAFRRESIPKATIKLKQAVGRLIRTPSDKGLVVILDPRVNCEDWGKQMLQSFPGGPGIPGSPYGLIRPADIPVIANYLLGQQAKGVA